MQHISDEERRRRIGSRHGLAPPARYADVESAATAMTALHATEAATVHLGLWARVDGMSLADVERALYDDRALVKQLAMRRTLWAFPRDLLPAVWGSAAARVAQQQRRQLVKDAAAAQLAPDPEEWVDDACAAVLSLLADGRARTTREIRDELPELEGRVTRGTPGAKWSGSAPIGPRVLTTLGAAGAVVRGPNAGHWRLNKPTWLRTEDWLGVVPTAYDGEAGYAALLDRWLWTFGPGTETDIVWWTGATKRAVRGALATLGAEQVRLDDGATGWVRRGDTEPTPPVEPWAALLPTLDPTTMGWKQRAFYLDPRHVPHLFDSNGNAGNTAWWDGRIVGAWAQDEDGAVRVLPREELTAAARTALDDEASRLTTWLDGVRIANVYASPQMKGMPLP